MAKEKMIKLKGWEMQIKMIQFCCFANQSGKNLEELQHLLAEDDTGKQKFPCIFCGNEICYLKKSTQLIFSKTQNSYIFQPSNSNPQTL